jgi:hypothetical protein
LVSIGCSFRQFSKGRVASLERGEGRGLGGQGRGERGEGRGLAGQGRGERGEAGLRRAGTVAALGPGYPLLAPGLALGAVVAGGEHHVPEEELALGEEEVPLRLEHDVLYLLLAALPEGPAAGEVFGGGALGRFTAAQVLPDDPAALP